MGPGYTLNWWMTMTTTTTSMTLWNDEKQSHHFAELTRNWIGGWLIVLFGSCCDLLVSWLVYLHRWTATGEDKELFTPFLDNIMFVFGCFYSAEIHRSFIRRCSTRPIKLIDRVDRILQTALCHCSGLAQRIQCWLQALWIDGWRNDCTCTSDRLGINEGRIDYIYCYYWFCCWVAQN